MPCAKKIEGKVMNSTLFDDESDNQSERSTWKEREKYGALIDRVNSRSDQK